MINMYVIVWHRTVYIYIYMHMSYHQCKSMSALAIWLRQMICFSNSTFSNIQCPCGPQPAIQGKQTLSGRERWWGYWWLHCGCVFLSGCGKGRTAEIGRRVGTSQRECYQWPSPCQRQVKKTPWHFPGLPCCTYCSGSFAIFAAEGSQKWFSLVQAGQTCWQELHCMTRSTSGRFLCFDHIQPSCREVLRRLERTRTSRTREEFWQGNWERVALRTGCSAAKRWEEHGKCC